MNFDNFTIKSQEVVQQAVQTAQQNGNQAIEPEHLLMWSTLSHEARRC